MVDTRAVRGVQGVERLRKACGGVPHGEPAGVPAVG